MNFFVASRRVAVANAADAKRFVLLVVLRGRGQLHAVLLVVLIVAFREDVFDLLGRHVVANDDDGTFAVSNGFPIDDDRNSLLSKKLVYLFIVYLFTLPL